jgi:hypothetical protein
MLGEQIAEVKGKITGQRVLDIEGPSIETSLSASGSLKGIQMKETITFVGKLTNTNGIIHGKGKAVIMAGESELATYTGEGIGRVNPSGSINWRGSYFFSTLHQKVNCHLLIIRLESLRQLSILRGISPRNFGSGNN